MAAVRVSPISKTAAILIIAIGVFVLFTGLVSDVPASDVAGSAFIVLGVFLYALLFRVTRKLQGDLEESSRQ